MNFINKIYESTNKLRGIFLLNHCPLMQEAIVSTSLDFVIIDLEASPFDRLSLLRTIQSLKNDRIDILVRTRNKEVADIEHILDLGISNLVIPKVSTAYEAQSIVDSSYFPPFGNRGLNPVRSSRYFDDVLSYVESSNDSLSVFVQIETSQGVKNINEIINIKGISGVFVGLGDLALSLGLPTQITHDKVIETLKYIQKCCASFNKPCGIFAPDKEFADTAEDILLYDFTAIGNDILWLKRILNQIKK